MIFLKFYYFAIAGLIPWGNIPFIELSSSSNKGPNNGSMKGFNFLRAQGDTLCDDGTRIELACKKSRFFTYIKIYLILDWLLDLLLDKYL